MMVLLDSCRAQWDLARHELPGIEIGQLLSPPTQRRDYGARYGIDNGGFNRFDKRVFLALLERQKPHRDRCLFVVAPDIVGSARRTLEVFHFWYPKLHGWPIALAIQNGAEDLPIPWELIDAVFIGGDDAFKDSLAAAQIVRTAKILEKWVHVGRVNEGERFGRFRKLGADSCDGTGISRFSRMRKSVLAAN